MTTLFLVRRGSLISVCLKDLAPTIEISSEHNLSQVIETTVNDYSIIVNLTEYPLNVKRLLNINRERKGTLLLMTENVSDIDYEHANEKLVIRDSEFTLLYVCGKFKKTPDKALRVCEFAIYFSDVDIIVALCQPYLCDIVSVTEHVIEELKSLYCTLISLLNEFKKSYHNVNLKGIVEELKRIIIEERRRMGKSRTLLSLKLLSEGNMSVMKNLSPVVIDILEDAGILNNGFINYSALKSVLKVLEEYVYPK